MDLKQTNREHLKALFDQLSDMFSCAGTFRKPGKDYADYLLVSLTPTGRKIPITDQSYEKKTSSMYVDFLHLFTPSSSLFRKEAVFRNLCFGVLELNPFLLPKKALKTNNQNVLTVHICKSIFLYKSI